MDVFGLTPAQFETFLLVAVRCTLIISFMPVISAQQVPLLVRVGLGLLVSFVVSTTVPTIAAFPDLYTLALAIFNQFVIASFYGFITYLVLMAAQFAGEILDIQVGYAIVNVLNPLTQQQVSVIGEFQLAIASLIFLISNAHLLVIQGLGGSFKLLPLPDLTLAITSWTSTLQFLTLSFALVFKIAGPVAFAVFIANVALGLMARVAPQMNVFVIGFPLQIGVGLTFIALSLPLLGYLLPDLYNQIPTQLDTILRELAGH